MVSQLISKFHFTLTKSTLDESMAADSPCGDWEPYKEEKCFKIFDKVGLQTYEDAEKACHQQENSSSLISIRFLEEQEFVSNLLKTHKVPNDVWIGVKYTNNKYKWTDDSDLVFTNWAQGSPKNQSYHCVQLLSDESLLGKWSNVLCNRKNLVVCQKMQTLSLSQLQKIIYDIKKNPVPIGFIYVQLPNEKSPTEIWPWMIWSDVSSVYAGVFFRVTGGEAASFGKVQEEFLPHISSFNRKGYNGDTTFNLSIDVPDSGWSDEINLGAVKLGGGALFTNTLRFNVSGGEVRPRNMAIRVWKRTG
jgi:hypothetical protein